MKEKKIFDAITNVRDELIEGREKQIQKESLCVEKVWLSQLPFHDHWLGIIDPRDKIKAQEPVPY